MIRIQCIKCHEVLTMDDAFAGGVCRCQHCGAIQTVPGKSKLRPVTPEQFPGNQADTPPVDSQSTSGQSMPGQPNSGQASTGQANTSQSNRASSNLTKAAGQASATPMATAGSGLDELAEIIASSGLNSSRLRKASASSSRSGPMAHPDHATRNRLLLLIAIAMIAAVAVLIFILFLLLRHKPANSAPPVTPGATRHIQISPQLVPPVITTSDNA